MVSSDPKTIRLNDAKDPDRLTSFEDALRGSAANGNEVIRQLVDAYVRYVDENGHSPTFPVRLIPAIVPTSKAAGDKTAQSKTSSKAAVPKVVRIKKTAKGKGAKRT